MIVDEYSRSSTLANNDPTTDALELIRSTSEDSSSFTAFWSTIVETCTTVVDDNVNSVKNIMPRYSTPAHFLQYDDEKYGDSNEEIYSPLLDDPADDPVTTMTVNSSRDDVPTTTLSSKSSLSYYNSITSFIDDAIRISGVSTAWEEGKEAQGEEEKKEEQQQEQGIVEKTVVKQGDKESVLKAAAVADAASPYFDDNQDYGNSKKKKKENCECNVVGCTLM
eukprot:CAMPEP_0113476252 /NCGR_PEP_ID=MMETSP0014_2-20120614/19563_1 /TAXON_ID=2857 /ORGANISM="Nitzschia sp." /LENGTH=221 /DNA_ID=CAMNT_0000369243 /DNA_START=78 /DNA_END=743 /DNA_ORIENTATION=+ /assembly_acc=CAM_ASM_000159